MTTTRILATAIGTVLLALVLTGCAGLLPGTEPPAVSVTSFALAPEAAGNTPRFNIGIHVVNPNRNPIRLRGMGYTVEIEGNRILNGANPDLPTVPGYDIDAGSLLPLTIEESGQFNLPSAR